MQSYAYLVINDRMNRKEDENYLQYLFIAYICSLTTAFLDDGVTDIVDLVHVTA